MGDDWPGALHLDKGWRQHRGRRAKNSATKRGRSIDLPHDWAIEPCRLTRLPTRTTDSNRSGPGFPEKQHRLVSAATFDLPAEDAGKRILASSLTGCSAMRQCG